MRQNGCSDRRHIAGSADDAAVLSGGDAAVEQSVDFKLIWIRVGLLVVVLFFYTVRQ